MSLGSTSIEGSMGNVSVAILKLILDAYKDLKSKE